MSDCDTDLIGYERMGCPRCTHEVLYKKDLKYRPICDRCGRKMKPICEVKRCDVDADTKQSPPSEVDP